MLAFMLGLGSAFLSFTALPAHRASNSQQAAATRSDSSTLAPPLVRTAERGVIVPSGHHAAAADSGNYRVIAPLENGALTDTSFVTLRPASPTPPPPSPAGAWHEPAGFRKITRRDFNSKAKTDSDRGPAGSQGWDGVEFRYANVQIAADSNAPLSPPSVLHLIYPPLRVPAGQTYSPGVVQTLGFASRHYRKLYLRTAFRVSANWQGHSSETNKVVFIRGQGGPRPEPIIRLRGAGSGPLALNVDLQGSPRDARNQAGVPAKQASLASNTPGAFAAGALAVPRGQWQVLEAVLEMGTNGAANGTLKLWLNGTLTHDYHNIEYEPTGAETWFWDAIHIAPTWGGQMGTIRQLMFLEFDDFYVSGAP